MEGLETLSLRELTSLLAAAEQRKMLLSRRRPISAVRKELIALAASYGYAIEELYVTRAARVTAKRSQRQKIRKVAVRYRDPESRRNTWTGRGRMPRWLANRVSRGERAADYLIPGLARPSEKSIKHIGRKTVYKPETHSRGALAAEEVRGGRSLRLP